MGLEMTRVPRAATAPWARAAWVCLGVLGLGLADASGQVDALAGDPLDVYISKYRKRLARDFIQLQNEEPFVVDLGGWRLSASLGEYVIPDGTTILGDGGTRTFSIAEITETLSEEIVLIDDLLEPAAGEVLVDRVRFGCAGGAPAPPAFPDSAALVRAPDPSVLPPQAPPDDENYWTIDLDADFGLPNAAPQPLLGSSLHINEVRLSFGTDPDSVELYNPFGAPQLLNGWFATSAAGVAPLNGIVPPFGFAAFPLPGLDLAFAGRLDLFDAEGVRVDQKAWCGGPFSECYGDCPDGAAPTNGYDFATSGGSMSWFALPCTLGEPNHLDGQNFCDPAGLPDDGVPDAAVEEIGWGALKSRFRTP